MIRDREDWGNPRRDGRRYLHHYAAIINGNLMLLFVAALWVKG